MASTPCRCYYRVLVSASPKELAGDVGALCGTANNMSTALGTAIMAAFAIGILGKLYNADNTIAVPGFYDDVVALTEAQREMIAKTDMSEEDYKAITGVPTMWGDQRFTIRERLAARPILDINGMWTGWSGPGPKTIIPSKAGPNLVRAWWPIRTHRKFTNSSSNTSSRSRPTRSS